MSLLNTVVPGHIMKAYEGVKVQLHSFLISGLNGDKRSVSGYGRFMARERTAGIH